MSLCTLSAPFLLLWIFIASGALSAAPDAHAAFGSETCSMPAGAKQNITNYIVNFAFDEGLAYCGDSGKCSATIRNWLAVREFSQGNYAAAEKWFAEAESLAAAHPPSATWKKKRGWGALDDVRRYLAARKYLGSVTPEYVQKIRVIYPRRTRALGPDGGKVLKYDGSVCNLRHLELNFGLLKQYIELFSRGKVSLAVDYQVVDADMTRMAKRGKGVLESLSPWGAEMDKLMADSAQNYDLVWFMYPYKGGIASGGLGRLPLDQSGKNTVGMRRVWYPDGWARYGNFPQFFHEYMHTVEFSMGIKITAHNAADTARILKQTGLSRGLGETDYAEWHFANTIPGKKSYEKAFGYPARKRQQSTADEDLPEEIPMHSEQKDSNAD